MGVKTEAEEPLLKTKKQKYKTAYFTIIRELILDVEGKVSLDVFLNENSFPTPGKDNKIHRNYFTINKMFYELKNHLYVQYHEDFVKFPEDLMARVNNFNNNKKSNRGKIELQNY
ncbi:MAG: hypothetical protein ACI8XB_002097 [Patiriisocius sp.]|jgi:hypothetical protein